MSQDGSEIRSMDQAERDASSVRRSAAELPTPLRLLFLGRREPNWVSLTLRLDATGCRESQFRWVSTSHEALALLRDECFDCILVAPDADSTGNEPSFPTLPFLRGLRASGNDDAVLAVVPAADEERDAAIYQEDGDLLIAPSLWDSVSLVPAIVRAVSRVELRRDNHRLATAHHRRLVRERDETEHLLEQQRQMISELELLARTSSTGIEDRLDSPPHDREADRQSSAGDGLSRQVNDYYHELLRTYVIMGSGSLGNEIDRVADLMAAAGLTPRESLQLHLERVETLVRGLGNRSARHVMARADLLALELMMHLAQRYQSAAMAQPEHGPQQSPAPTSPADSAGGHCDKDEVRGAVSELRQRVKRLAAG